MNDNAASSNSHSTRVLVALALLFAGSGCAALIYEIVWYQLLEFVIGSTSVSLGVLLGTFMGGLCLGSLALPRISSLRRHHPLRVFAAVELGIGLCGILVLLGMPLVDGLYVAAVGSGFPAVILRAIVAALCLLPPTVLMGASLPAVARWVETSKQGVSWLGLLYGVNIVGAVAGCLLAGFFLLRVFDMATGTYTAAAINASVALIAFLLSLRTPERATENAAEPRPDAASRYWPAYLTIGLSGACALGAETVWMRVLALTFGATVYTFSIILAVFLVGLGIGGAAGSWISRRTHPQNALGYAQLALSAAIAWTAFMLARVIPYWAAPIDSPTWITFQTDLLRATVAMLPAALLWGASFPLAMAAAAAREEDPARLVGGIYAANTAGAILGALVFGLVLIPGVGTIHSQRILIVLSAVSALCALLPVAGPRGARSAALAGVAAGIAIPLAWTVPAIPDELTAYGRRFLSNLGKSQVLYIAEGLNSTIAITQWDDVTQFHVSGKVEASTGVYDMRLQRTLGHMPALLHTRPRSVLIVGFGAGVTAGSFTLHPDVERIVICEIEPLIPPTATRYFGEQNYNVMNDPRTEMVYDDARHYVLTTKETFDVITSDPIHPWVKGSAALYTKEYFEMVKSHLNPGGIVTQWVPLYETGLDTVKSVVATFFDVFPNGTIWANEDPLEGGYDVFLLAQNEPTAINVDSLQERLDQPSYARVADSLGAVGLRSALDLLSIYAAQARDLAPWLDGAEINRDGNLRLQFIAGWSVNSYLQGPIYDQMLSYRQFPANLITGSDEPVQTLRRRLVPPAQDYDAP
jgi:spermidine synthase